MSVYDLYVNGDLKRSSHNESDMFDHVFRILNAFKKRKQDAYFEVFHTDTLILEFKYDHGSVKNMDREIINLWTSKVINEGYE